MPHYSTDTRTNHKPVVKFFAKESNEQKAIKAENKKKGTNESKKALIDNIDQLNQTILNAPMPSN